jgi:hypothetical protein
VTEDTFRCGRCNLLWPRAEQHPEPDDRTDLIRELHRVGHPVYICKGCASRRPLGTCACGQGIFVTIQSDGHPGSECGGWGGEGVCCIYDAKPGVPCPLNHLHAADEVKRCREAHDLALASFTYSRAYAAADERTQALLDAATWILSVAESEALDCPDIYECGDHEHRLMDDDRADLAALARRLLKQPDLRALHPDLKTERKEDDADDDAV